MNLLDLLFPRRCVGCGKIGTYFCARCYDSIRFIEYPICPVCMKQAMGGATHPRCRTPLSLDGMYAAVHYTGVVRNAIRLMKYRYVRDLISALADIFFKQYPNTMPRFDSLIPVPLHTKRQRERGFNQSALLAHYVGKQLSIPVIEGAIQRVHNTTPQFGLTKEKRRENMMGAFAYTRGNDLKGKSVAIIDDVATTMATLSECTMVLKRRGAQTVWALVLAHG